MDDNTLYLKSIAIAKSISEDCLTYDEAKKLLQLVNNLLLVRLSILPSQS